MARKFPSSRSTFVPPARPRRDRSSPRPVGRNTALGDQSQFHVGQRVQYDTGAHIRHGTVTRGLQNNGYLVARDDFVGKGMPDDILLPEDIHPLNDGSQAPAQPSYPVMREPMKAPEQETANAGAPPEALVRRLIQSGEETSTVEAVINVDIHSLEIGRPRKIVPLLDRGIVGDANTIIYPVHVTLTHKTFEDQGARVVISEIDALYNCYIDAFGRWQCGRASSKTSSPRKRGNGPEALRESAPLEASFPSCGWAGPL